MSSYNGNGSSSNTYGGSIEDLGLQLYQFKLPANENDQETGGDHN